jgi:hypothetical protein
MQCGWQFARKNGTSVSIEYAIAKTGVLPATCTAVLMLFTRYATASSASEQLQAHQHTRNETMAVQTHCQWQSTWVLGMLALVAIKHQML